MRTVKWTYKHDDANSSFFFFVNAPKMCYYWKVSSLKVSMVYYCVGV